MKITQVETLVINMPMQLDGPVPMQGGQARTSIDMLLVRIDTDVGLTGWGEGFGHRIWPATRAAIDTLIGPMCVGRDATAINALIDDLQRNLHGVGRNGPAMYALSAIDIALWDIAGKAANLPLYRLLGGSPRQDLPAYASLLRYNDPAAVARYTEQALRRGYGSIKLHQIDVPSVKAMWLEEPVWPPEDFGGLARVRAAGGLAIAAGENATTADFRRMFEVGAVTYAQPSITKVGGVTEMRKVMTLANAFGVHVVPHSAYFGPGLIASMHCIAAMPQESLVERYACDFDLNPLHDAIHPRDGRIAVPQAPGLGVELDAKVIEQLRVG
jgi:D-galactarolactone cycloisomerase